MTATFLSQLMNRCSVDHGVVPRLAGHIEPLAAIYPKACRRIAEALMEGGSLSASHFARLCASAGLVSFQDCPPCQAIRFTNWNCPEDLLPIRRSRQPGEVIKG